MSAGFICFALGLLILKGLRGNPLTLNQYGSGTASPTVLSPSTSLVALAMKMWMKSRLDVCGKGGGGVVYWRVVYLPKVCFQPGKSEMGVALFLFIRHESHYTRELGNTVLLRMLPQFTEHRFICIWRGWRNCGAIKEIHTETGNVIQILQIQWRSTVGTLLERSFVYQLV